MKLTPLDIQQQKFEVKWRGYDRQEVETFLEMVSEDVESLWKDFNKLRDELKKCESQLADFRENERAIQQTIMTTQKEEKCTERIRSHFKRGKSGGRKNY